jgi:hypothetical protein
MAEALLYRNYLAFLREPPIDVGERSGQSRPDVDIVAPYYEPDVAADASDRGENRDPGLATKEEKNY